MKRRSNEVRTREDEERQRPRGLRGRRALNHRTVRKAREVSPGFRSPPPPPLLLGSVWNRLIPFGLQDILTSRTVKRVRNGQRTKEITRVLELKDEAPSGQDGQWGAQTAWVQGSVLRGPCDTLPCKYYIFILLTGKAGDSRKSHPVVRGGLGRACCLGEGRRVVRRGLTGNGRLDQHSKLPIASGVPTIRSYSI
jgi:hypothetical protein